MTGIFSHQIKLPGISLGGPQGGGSGLTPDIGGCQSEPSPPPNDRKPYQEKPTPPGPRPHLCGAGGDLVRRPHGAVLRLHQGRPMRGPAADPSCPGVALLRTKAGFCSGSMKVSFETYETQGAVCLYM